MSSLSVSLSLSHTQPAGSGFLHAPLRISLFSCRSHVSRPTERKLFSLPSQPRVETQQLFSSPGSGERVCRDVALVSASRKSIVKVVCLH